MAARQLHHHPAWTVAGLAADRRPPRPLELLAAENLSVAAALDLSYADLAPDRQRLSGGSACTPAAISTRTPPPLSMAPAWTPPAAAWRRSTEHYLLAETGYRAGTGCTT